MNSNTKIYYRFRDMRRNESGFTLVDLMMAMCIIGVLSLVPMTMLANSAKKKREAAGIEDNAPIVPEPVVPSAPAPEFPLGMVLGIGVSLLLLAGLVWAGFIIFRKVSEANRVASKNLYGWQTLVDHHGKIRSEWMAYETDILKIVDFPLLSDMSEPVTIKLHEALRKASLHEPKNIKSLSRVPFNGSEYDVAVQELDTAFRAAESKARLSSWNKFTVEEKKRLQRAKDLLAMAMNGASTPSERQSAYKQAMKALQGLIEVPKATILAIESNTQLALVA